MTDNAVTDDAVLRSEPPAQGGAGGRGRGEPIGFGTGPELRLSAKQLEPEVLRRLVDSAPEGVAVVDPASGRYLYVNPAGCRLLGQPPQELPCAPASGVPGASECSDSSVEAMVVAQLELEVSRTALAVGGRLLEAVRFRDVSRARQHERHLAAFSRTAASIAFAGQLSTVLDRLAEEVRSATGMFSCTFLLVDEDGHLRQVGGAAQRYPAIIDYAERLEQCRALGAPLLSMEAFRSRQPMVAKGWRERTLTDPRFTPIHDIARDAPWDTLATVPVIHRGRVIAVLNAFYLAGTEPSADDLSFLVAVADQAAVAVENARLLGVLESKAALEERHRLARELHDSVNQALFSLTLQARAMELAVRSGAVPVDILTGRLADIRELTEGALAEMRALIFQLRPAALHEEGLVSAVRKQAAAVAAREALAVQVEGPDGGLTMAPQTEEQVFRVVQEALHNVVKHASATRVTIRIGLAERQRDVLEVSVLDDGGGFDTGADHLGHLGLESMAERIAQVGGTMTVQSGPDGTTVRARIPGVRAAAEATR